MWPPRQCAGGHRGGLDLGKFAREATKLDPGIDQLFADFQLTVLPILPLDASSVSLSTVGDCKVAS
jgi:hypothetical protein